MGGAGHCEKMAASVLLAAPEARRSRRHQCNPRHARHVLSVEQPWMSPLPARISASSTCCPRAVAGLSAHDAYRLGDQRVRVRSAGRSRDANGELVRSRRRQGRATHSAETA